MFAMTPSRSGLDGTKGNGKLDPAEQWPAPMQ